MLLDGPIRPEDDRAEVIETQLRLGSGVRQLMFSVECNSGKVCKVVSHARNITLGRMFRNSASCKAFANRHCHEDDGRDCASLVHETIDVSMPSRSATRAVIEAGHFMGLICPRTFQMDSVHSSEQ